MITLTNVAVFQFFLIFAFSDKLRERLLQTLPFDLKSDATLPCEMCCSAAYISYTSQTHDYRSALRSRQYEPIICVFLQAGYDGCLSACDEMKHDISTSSFVSFSKSLTCWRVKSAYNFHDRHRVGVKLSAQRAT